MTEHKRNAKAASEVRAILAKPMPKTRDDLMDCETFDPWNILPCVYGSYSAEYDWTIIAVLRNLLCASNGEWDAQSEEELPHHIFREMLCTANLCDYGTSPRVCFATLEFAKLLPELIERWEQFSSLSWGVKVPAT